MAQGLTGESVVAGVFLLGSTLLVAGCDTRTQWLVLKEDGGTADAGEAPDADLTCNGLLVRCEGECVDLSTNPDHCGGCDGACAPGEQCASGNCLCPAGTEICGETCRDTTRDPLHCGQCDQRCEGEEQCEGGLCVCRPGFERCDGECVDKRLDPAHCGVCNNDCTATATPYCADGSCSATACEDQIPASVTCGSDEMSCVLAVDLQTSPLHCGECGTDCETNEICNSGQCQSYYPAAGCTTCPCADVCGTNLCCTLPGVAAPTCLVGATSCP